MRWILLLALGPGCSGGGLAGLEVDLPRREPGQVCPTRDLPPADADCAQIPDVSCVSNVECTDGDNGVCEMDGYGSECSCFYDACSTDADCEEGYVACACADDPLYDNRASSRCLGGNCSSDADCDSGLCLGNHGTWCGTADHDDLLPVTGWFCATEADTCRSDSVCDTYDRCMYGVAANPNGFSCSRDYQATCE